MNFIWSRLGPFLRTKTNTVKYHDLHIHRVWEPLRKLDKAIPSVLKASPDFYRRYRGNGEEQHDPSSFFRIRGRHKQFEEWWSSRKNSRRKLTEGLFLGFEQAVAAHEIG